MVFEDKIIDIKKITNKSTILSVVQNSDLPFQIKRAFWIKNMDPNEVRGKHAHYRSRHFLICIKGKCIVNLDDGVSKENIILSDDSKGILIEPNYWRIMRDFSEDCIILILSSEEYDEKDYIRDYKKFKEIYSK